MEESSWCPSSWVYREKRPQSDDVYFENMTRIIFQAGLSWKMINKKWQNFKKAFENFSISKVAEFDDSDLARLMTDKGIVRNRRKIEATIKNAKEFQKIKERESFQSYLDSLDKSQNYVSVIKELSNRFQRLGPSSARIFLYSVGENARHPEE
ncbi:MAG: DNA-3-methyladenine glycosylase I [Candidatus Bathyarchaeota archaeon]|nr:DNA-3-methyladenine glycosylase I [Candidatus Bathyarchaeota archaeon]MDH5495493.1 DNA-3-methyladenine glycosylase I [Candidatus Bathyarchaeota archaeon]